MLYKILFLFLFSVSALFGISDEAKTIKGYYKSLAKDFLIYEFLKKKTTSKEDAKALYSEVKRMTSRMQKAFNKKIDDKKFLQKDDICSKLKGKEFIRRCTSLGITPKKLQKMSLKEQKQVYKKLVKKHGKQRVSWIKSMIAKDTFGSLVKGDGKDYLKVFYGVNDRYKQKVLDKSMPVEFLTKLANQKGFERFILHVTMSQKYKKIPKSLLHVSHKRKSLSYDSAFYLGILATQHGHKKKALNYFQRAQSEAKYSFSRDNAIFWQYLVSDNIKLLGTLALSEDLNIYSMYAKEKLKLKGFEILSPNPKLLKLKDYSITDPFTWAYTNDHAQKMKPEELEKFAEKFYTHETLGHYAYFMEKASKYKKNYFIMPYNEYLKETNATRKTLIYSLARQESRFIPAAVSTSYALGMMQFMPFLANAIAKDENMTEFVYFDMFKPKVALQFANIHLDYLNSFLYHPLFVAYAYNGGIGFTKRMLTTNNLFNSGAYEPFLSMELVPYKESRKYGKKVLANYVIYSNLNNEHTTLIALLEKLKKPYVNDRFRKRD